MPIGKRLSDLLNARNENVNSVSAEIGVSPQTLYSIIKRDNMKVDFDVLMKLSKVLNVSVEYFYEPQMKKSPAPAEAEAGGLLDEKRLLTNYNDLNKEGKEKLLSYSDDLISSGNYAAQAEDA